MKEITIRDKTSI